MMMGVCGGKKGIEKVLCMNAESRKMNTPTAPDRKTSRAKESMESCKGMTGMERGMCVRTANKNSTKATERRTNPVVPQNRAIATCAGKRGGALSACFQKMENKAAHKMMKKSSSSESSSTGASY
jgi:hypothetical protein